MTQKFNRRNGDALMSRIDERLNGLVDSFKSHEGEDGQRFNLVFSQMKEGFDKIDKKLDILWDASNQNKGMFTASKLIAGSVWAIVVLAASWFMQRIG